MSGINLNPVSLQMANLRKFLDRTCNNDQATVKSEKDRNRLADFIKKHKIPLAIRCTLYKGTSTHATFEVVIMERLPKDVGMPTVGEARDWYVLHVAYGMSDVIAWLYMNGYKDNPTLYIPA